MYLKNISFTYRVYAMKRLTTGQKSCVGVLYAAFNLRHICPRVSFMYSYDVYTYIIHIHTFTQIVSDDDEYFDVGKYLG